MQSSKVLSGGTRLACGFTLHLLKGIKFRFLLVFKKQDSVSIRIVGNCSSASSFVPELFLFLFVF